jgi:hypothetical protein
VSCVDVVDDVVGGLSSLFEPRYFSLNSFLKKLALIFWRLSLLRGDDENDLPLKLGCEDVRLLVRRGGWRDVPPLTPLPWTPLPPPPLLLRKEDWPWLVWDGGELLLEKEFWLDEDGEPFFIDSWEELGEEEEEVLEFARFNNLGEGTEGFVEELLFGVLGFMLGDEEPCWMMTAAAAGEWVEEDEGLFDGIGCVGGSWSEANIGTTVDGGGRGGWRVEGGAVTGIFCRLDEGGKLALPLGMAPKSRITCRPPEPWILSGTNDDDDDDRLDLEDIPLSLDWVGVVGLFSFDNDEFAVGVLGLKARGWSIMAVGVVGSLVLLPTMFGGVGGLFLNDWDEEVELKPKPKPPPPPPPPPPLAGVVGLDDVLSVEPAPCLSSAVTASTWPFQKMNKHDCMCSKRWIFWNMYK